MEIKVSCPLCEKSYFPNIISLRNELINVTKKPLTCPICEDVLFGLDKFTIHLFAHCHIIYEQDPPKKLKEIVSSYDNNNNNQQNNILISNKVTSVDPTTLNTSNYLKPLIETTDNVDNSLVHCEICSCNFSDANMLKMHNDILHSNDFSCHLCPKKFKMHGSLKVHMRVAHSGLKNKFITIENKNKTENITQTQTDTLNQTKTIDNKQWECEVCLKKFTTKYFLKKHKRLHTGEMPYECNICNKSFTFQQSFHKHMLYHSAEKPHTCTECGRSFKELSTLHNHQRIHSGERPFACETCGKRFRQRVSYLVHKRIHTGAMPYKCTACNKSFRYKVSQRTHKCKAQPPGSVVRQFGELVQKLLQNRQSTTETETNVASPVNDLENNIAANTSTDIRSEKLIKNTPEMNMDFFGLVMSPTFHIPADQFESLCLSNKDNEIKNNQEIYVNQHLNMTTSIDNNDFRQECSTVNEDCFKQLLYNTPE